MKTAMQELIDYLEKAYYVKEIIDWEEYKIELLEKEKEQLKDAVIYGYSNWGSQKDEEKYYNQTYNQKK